MGVATMEGLSWVNGSGEGNGVGEENEFGELEMNLVIGPWLWVSYFGLEGRVKSYLGRTVWW